MEKKVKTLPKNAIKKTPASKKEVKTASKKVMKKYSTAIKNLAKR